MSGSGLKPATRTEAEARAEREGAMPKMKARFHKTLSNPTVPGGEVDMWEMATKDGETILSVAVIAGARGIPPFIARACNSHDALVKALTGLLDNFGGYNCPEVDAAIAIMQQLGLDRWSMQARMDAEAALNAAKGEA